MIRPPKIRSTMGPQTIRLEGAAYLQACYDPDVLPEPPHYWGGGYRVQLFTRRAGEEVDLTEPILIHHQGFRMMTSWRVRLPADPPFAVEFGPLTIRAQGH